MAYTPINWQTGDTITAEKLNRCDNGWAVESTQLFSETVTTVDYGGGFYGAELTYSQLIDFDTITVTFDGTDYTCPLISNDDGNIYGGFNEEPDFSDFPFFIVSNGVENLIFTETAGNHTVAVTAPIMTVSNGFAGAVGSVVDPSRLPLRCVNLVTTDTEIEQAVADGRLLYFQDDYRYYVLTYANTNDLPFEIAPVNSHITATVYDGIFTLGWS